MVSRPRCPVFHGGGWRVVAVPPIQRHIFRSFAQYIPTWHGDPRRVVVLADRWVNSDSCIH